MKNIYGILALIVAFSLLLMPLTAVRKEKSVPTLSEIDISGSKVNTDSFKIKNSETGEIQKVALKDYIFGVVAAEMPALYHEEALKAQSVAAFTYALYKSEQNKGKEFDLTDSFAVDQAFITRDKAREKWGEKADEYEAKIDKAAESVKGEVLTYDGKIILSVYTAVSSGRTESAKNVWDKDIPYLTAVESIGDLLCPDYLSSASFTAEEVKNLLCTPKNIDSEYTSWFKEPVLSENGTVKSMKFGEASLSGDAIREALNLRSCNFDVVFKDGKFNFSVRGYGHLLGMSQYGANYMAMQGSDYKEILSWYYKGCKTEKLKP